MAKFKVEKRQGPETNDFTTTLKFEVLHCSTVDNNNNKFYCIELQENSNGQYRLFTHYGRLGKTNVYEVRQTYSDGSAITQLHDIEREFNSIIKKKKTKKYVQVETVAPTIGSSNIRNQQQINEVEGSAANLDTSSYVEPTVARLIDQFIKENIHNITSKTSLVLTDNGFETPLGPVTLDQITKARIPLDDLKAMMKKDSIEENSNAIDCNNKFFSLIPHPFGSRIRKDDWILNSEKLAAEYELLEQLETAVKMGSSMNNNKNRMEALGTDIELVTDKKLIKHYENKFESTRARNHGNLARWKFKNLFKICIPNERKKFETALGKYETVGEIEELFHGSRVCNCLSILKGGLIIPPVNAGHVTGRMFGNGVYGASNSTKALNYATGWWSGRKDGNNAFLFVVNFAMGKTYECFSQQYNGAPSGYHSVHAKAGRSLYNDEYIVYKLEQQTIKYMIELEEK